MTLQHSVFSSLLIKPGNLAYCESSISIKIYKTSEYYTVAFAHISNYREK